MYHVSCLIRRTRIIIDQLELERLELVLRCCVVKWAKNGDRVVVLNEHIQPLVLEGFLAVIISDLSDVFSYYYDYDYYYYVLYETSLIGYIQIQSSQVTLLSDRHANLLTLSFRQTFTTIPTVARRYVRLPLSLSASVCLFVCLVVCVFICVRLFRGGRVSDVALDALTAISPATSYFPRRPSIQLFFARISFHAPVAVTCCSARRCQGIVCRHRKTITSSFACRVTVTADDIGNNINPGRL